MCVYYVFERGMDRGADGGGGRGRDSTRKGGGLERETNMTSQQEIPFPWVCICKGGGNRGTRRNFLCVWCLCWYVWVWEDNETWGQRVCHRVRSGGSRWGPSFGSVLRHIGRPVTHLGRPMDDYSYKTKIAELWRTLCPLTKSARICNPRFSD